LLDRDAEITIWNEGVFRLGSTFIESLITSLPTFDFAILVLTPDDLVLTREQRVLSARDNVLFELGLFMGGLGRDHTFVVHPIGNDLKVPTDLVGLVTATYEWPRRDGNIVAALGPACDQIRPLIRSLGPPRMRIVGQMQAVEAQQQRQQGSIDALAFVVAHLLPQFQLEHLEKLQAGQKFDYGMHPGFERELRHLWELGFIRKRRDFKIAEMPPIGNLHEFFEISEQGKTYLQLRQQSVARHPASTDVSQRSTS
jgi:hypothetical protein